MDAQQQSKEATPQVMRTPERRPSAQIEALQKSKTATPQMVQTPERRQSIPVEPMVQPQQQMPPEPQPQEISQQQPMQEQQFQPQQQLPFEQQPVQQQPAAPQQQPMFQPKPAHTFKPMNASFSSVQTASSSSFQQQQQTNSYAPPQQQPQSMSFQAPQQMQQMQQQQQQMSSYSFQSQSSSSMQMSQSAAAIPMQGLTIDEQIQWKKEQQRLQQLQNQQEARDYTGSLRPTQTGALIRSQGDIPQLARPKSGLIEPEGDEVTPFTSLRPTGMGEVIRQTGDVVKSKSAVGLQNGEESSPFSSLRPTELGQQIKEVGDIQRTASQHQQQNTEVIDQQRHSVRNMVQHFRQQEQTDSQPPMPQAAFKQRPRSQSARRAPVQQQQQPMPVQQPVQQQPPQQMQQQPAQEQTVIIQSDPRNNRLSACLTMDSLDGYRGGFMGQQQPTNGIQDPSEILGGMAFTGGQSQLQQQQYMLPPQDIQDIHNTARGSSMQPLSQQQQPQPIQDGGPVGSSNQKATNTNLKARFSAMLADLDSPLPPMQPIPSQLQTSSKANSSFTNATEYSPIHSINHSTNKVSREASSWQRGQGGAGLGGIKAGPVGLSGQAGLSPGGLGVRQCDVSKVSKKRPLETWPEMLARCSCPPRQRAMSWSASAQH